MGTVSVPPFGIGFPELPKINPILKPYVKFLLGNKLQGDVIISKYALARTYVRAEYESVSRFIKPDLKPDLHYFQRAVDMMDECFNCLHRSATLEMESAKENLNKSTACGYPWMLKYRNKRDLFASGNFLPYYVDLKNDVSKGVPRTVFWKSFIKSEFKKKTDLNAHLPRTILGCPVELALLGNELFGVMNGKMAQGGANWQLPIWVGKTKYNRNWHRLATKLTKFKWLFDGDISKFDGSARKFFLRFVRDMRKSWLYLQDISTKNRVDWYYAQVIYSLIVTYIGELILKLGGQPSGQVNTLTDNTLIHLSLWFYHWSIHAIANGFEPTWDDFKKHVELMVMGDDVIYSCDDDVYHFMKPSEVAKTMASVGFHLKHSADGGINISDADFCSTGFGFVDDCYVPLPKHDKSLLSIVADKGGVRNPRLILRRLMSLRVECFWDKPLLDIIEAAIAGIKADYAYELRQIPTGQGGDDQTYDQILAVEFSYGKIESMYNRVVA